MAVESRHSTSWNVCKATHVFPGVQDPAEHGIEGERYQDTEMDHPTATS